MQCAWRCFAIAVAVLSYAAVAAAADDAAARELVRQVLDALPKEPYVARLKVTVPNGPPRTLEVRQKIIDGARVTYLEVVVPDELAGVRFLFRQSGDRPNEQFVKLPASRVLVQVAEAVRTQPFLNSTFYISDLVEPPLDQFEYAFVGEEQLLGRTCRLVEARPKTPQGQVYGKTVLSLDPKDRLLLRRQFFAPDGALLKVWTVEKVANVDGQWTMLEQKMENVPDKTASELDVESITYGAALDDAMFQPKYLLR